MLFRQIRAKWTCLPIMCWAKTRACQRKHISSDVLVCDTIKFGMDLIPSKYTTSNADFITV